MTAHITKAGIIGIGSIGSAVATGLARAGHPVVISRRGAVRSAALAAAFANITAAENQSVLDQTGVVFIALNDADAVAALKPLEFRPDHVVISLMAGMELTTLGRLIAPANARTIMIPFPAIADGGSPVLVMGDAAPVEQIFGQTDSVIPVADRGELNAFLAAQAILSPVAVMVSGTAKWAGSHGGDTDKAERFLRWLIASSLSGMPSDDLITALNTPDGYNQRLRQYFEQQGLSANIDTGLSKLNPTTGKDV